MILATVEAQVLNIDATDLYGNKTLSRAATKLVFIRVVGLCWLCVICCCFLDG